MTIAARNGDPLDAPALVMIALPDTAGTAERAKAEQITARTVAFAGDFCASFLEADPVTAFHRQVADDL